MPYDKPLGIGTNPINTDKVITLTRSSIANESKFHTNWRYALYDLLNNGTLKDSKGKMIDKPFVVNDGIQLLLTDDPKDFSIKVDNEQKPIKQFVDSLTGLSPKTKAIGQILSGGASLLSAIKTQSIGDKDSVSGNFQPWVQNVRAYGGTSDGVGFSYTFNFSMGQYGLWDAKEEVVKPILALLAPTLPQHLDAMKISGNIPNALGFISNLFEGDSDYKNTEAVLDTETDTPTDTPTPANSSSKPFLLRMDDKLTEFASKLENVVLSSYGRYTWDIKFGKVTEFRYMIMSGSSFKFSRETDQHGYPISGNITISFIGTIPPVLTTSNLNTAGIRFGF